MISSVDSLENRRTLNSECTHDTPLAKAKANFSANPSGIITQQVIFSLKDTHTANIYYSLNTILIYRNWKAFGYVDEELERRHSFYFKRG